MTDLLAALAAPFDPEIISWRVGSTTGDKKKGMALGYIDARDVMERLDTVVGPANWQDRYEFHGPRTVCYLSLRIDGEWITKADGAGDSDVESEKGAISDALKRAAVKWGIGRYLYDLSSPWVEIEGQGRSYRIKPSERAKLVAAARAGGNVANRIAAEREAAAATTEEPSTEAAADFAIATMRTCRNLAELTDFWLKNAKGLKAALSDADFARVEAAKDEEKSRHQDNPFSEAA
jgi:hypothetical protein